MYYNPAQVEIANVASALANPARVKIVEYLADHGRVRFKTIQELMPLSKATVSQHLHMLEKYNIICSKEEGRCNYYYLSDSYKERVTLLSDFFTYIANNL